MRRTIIGILFVFAAVMTSAFSVWRSPIYQQCRADEAQQRAAQKKDERDPAFMPYIDCLGPFTRENHGPITAVFTIFLGIGTFLLWWTTRDLVEGAEKTARRQLRAYVFPFSATVFDRGAIPNAAHQNSALSGYIAAHMIIQNSGQTPAYEVIHWSEVDVRRIDEEHSLKVPSPLDRQGMATIPPTGTTNKTRYRPAQLSQAEINGIVVGSYAIYVWGRIEYVDSFHRDRFTNYRLRYTGTYPPDANALMSFCDGGNETDEHE